MVQGLSGVKAFRRRKFIFYWITLEEQISIQTSKSECLERNSFLETLAFLSSLFSLSNRSIFPCKACHDYSWNATQKSGNSSLGSQSGEPQRQFLKSWGTSHKQELHVGLRGSDRSRSDFFLFWLQTLKAILWQCYRSNIYTRMKDNFVKAFAQIKNFIFPCYYL